MRNFKFRVWDGKNQKFCQDPRTEIAYLRCEPMVMEFASFGKVIQQFTGLLDKNGCEIYEGDIVSFHSFNDEKIRSGKVEWFQYSFVINEKNMWGLNFDSFPISQIVVLGNIFENPELLKNE